VYEQQQEDTTPSIANAGFWARLLALVVDFLLVAVPALVVVNLVLFPLETAWECTLWALWADRLA
jgi:hypothetical protein